MPADLGNAAGAEPITFDEFVARIDETGCDLSNADGVAAAGALLARLHANTHFLADHAIEELKLGCRDQDRLNGYGAQVLMLHRMPGRHFLRANFWPAADDPVLRASGPGHYFYHVPHDHNFDFVTVGHRGPGYGSLWYEYDYAALDGMVGEAAGLVATARGSLGPGQMMHYRAHRDVHAQLPPACASISLNIVPERAEAMWFDQYLFDTSADTIAALPTVSPAEVLLRIAVVLDAGNDGGGNARDLAERFAQAHPSDRVRWNAWRALISAGAEKDRRHLLERATFDISRLVSGNAAAMLDDMDADRARAAHA